MFLVICGRSTLYYAQKYVCQIIVRSFIVGYQKCNVILNLIYESNKMLHQGHFIISNHEYNASMPTQNGFIIIFLVVLCWKVYDLVPDIPQKSSDSRRLQWILYQILNKGKIFLNCNNSLFNLGAILFTWKSSEGLIDYACHFSGQIMLFKLSAPPWGSFCFVKH